MFFWNTQENLRFFAVMGVPGYRLWGKKTLLMREQHVFTPKKILLVQVQTIFLRSKSCIFQKFVVILQGEMYEHGAKDCHIHSYVLCLRLDAC